jgi:hypothetical protein
MEGTAEADKLSNQWRDQIQTVARLKDQAFRLEQGFESVGDQDTGVAGLSQSLEVLYNKIAAAESKAGDLAAAMRSIPGAPVGSGSTEIPIVEGGAAGGVFANRPGLVLFGEGGEQEVGGPKSFFKQVFEELGVPAGGGGGGSAVTLNVTINALDGASVSSVFYGQIVPMLKEALRGNIGGLQTDFKALTR